MFPCSVILHLIHLSHWILCLSKHDKSWPSIAQSNTTHYRFAWNTLVGFHLPSHSLHRLEYISDLASSSIFTATEIVTKWLELQVFISPMYRHKRLIYELRMVFYCFVYANSVVFFSLLLLRLLLWSMNRTPLQRTPSCTSLGFTNTMIPINSGKPSRFSRHTIWNRLDISMNIMI